jgi:hypothetical protein
MDWILLVIAVALLATWVVLHFVFAISLGVMNLLWMIAFLMAVLWGVQWCD